LLFESCRAASARSSIRRSRSWLVLQLVRQPTQRVFTDGRVHDGVDAKSARVRGAPLARDADVRLNAPVTQALG